MAGDWNHCVEGGGFILDNPAKHGGVLKVYLPYANGPAHPATDCDVIVNYTVRMRP